MRDNITNKNILFLCSRFFGYEEKITEMLYRLGARRVYYKECAFFEESFRDNVSFYTLKKFLKNPRYRDNWTTDFWKEISEIRFDTFFVLENLSFSKWFIRRLKSENPSLRSILFLWDKFSTQQPRYFDYLPLFDKVYTFDRDDARRCHISYFPDFYIESPHNETGDSKYDVTFIGTMHNGTTDFRGEVLKKIEQECNRKGLSSFLWLYHSKYQEPRRRYIRWFRNHIKPNAFKKAFDGCQGCDFLHNTPLPLEEYYKILNHSKAIIDINHRNRQGMTLNVIEALASGKKLITTNNRIMDEPFYDPNMILVINENNPIVDKSFLDAPSKIVDFSELRLDNWLKHVINEEK